MVAGNLTILTLRPVLRIALFVSQVKAVIEHFTQGICVCFNTASTEPECEVNLPLTHPSVVSEQEHQSVVMSVVYFSVKLNSRYTNISSGY
jgi:hypothetical protein